MITPQICKSLKKLITILLLCVLTSHISETFLKKSCYVDIAQEVENEKSMKKVVEKKEMKDFIYNSRLFPGLRDNGKISFSLIIIGNLTDPILENIVPPPNA